MQPAYPWHPIPTPHHQHIIHLVLVHLFTQWCCDFKHLHLLLGRYFVLFSSFLWCVCLGLLCCTAEQKYQNINARQEFVCKYPNSLTQRRAISKVYLPPHPHCFQWNQTPCLAINPSVTISCLPTPTGVSWDHSQITYLHTNPCLRICFCGTPSKKTCIVSLPWAESSLEVHS